MTPIQFVFLFTAGFTLIGALGVVTRRNTVHSALFLVVSLFGVAVMFAILDAGYWAVIQVLVYIGAIAILMIFVVMLTRRNVADETYPEPYNDNMRLAFLTALLVFSGLALTIGGWDKARTTELLPLPENVNNLIDLGLNLFRPEGYLVPTITVAALLLAALVGSIYVAVLGNKSQEERE